MIFCLFFGTLSGFGKKLFFPLSGSGSIFLPKPEEIPKKAKTRLKEELLDSKLSL